jgi:hypothetical protein
MAGGITTSGAITATKLSLKLYGVGTVTECIVSIHAAASGSAAIAYGLITSPQIGWNDVTINTALDATTSYNIWVGCNQAYYSDWKSTGTYYYDAGTAYQNTPRNYLSTSDTGTLPVRVGY